MKTYKHKSRQTGFEILIPDNWSRSLVVDLLSNSKTITGPDGEYMNILITPLQENEPEATIEETAEYFDGLTYREQLHVIATGTIIVENKDHFWAKYYRMTLIGKTQLQFFKKYCLFLNRTEYLITAGLWDAAIKGKAPTDQQLGEYEKLYDKIVTSFKSQTS